MCIDLFYPNPSSNLIVGRTRSRPQDCLSLMQTGCSAIGSAEYVLEVWRTWLSRVGWPLEMAGGPEESFLQRTVPVPSTVPRDPLNQYVQNQG